MKQGSAFDYQLLGRVLRLAFPFKRIFIFAGVLAVVIAPLSALRPYLIQVLVDDYVFRFDIPGMQKMALIIFALLLVSSILQYFFIFYTNVLGQSVIRDLRDRVFRHITSLKLTYFDRTPIGTSTTRTINDIETINTVFTQGAITIIADLLTLFAVLAIMMYTSLKLTLICLTTMPFLIIATYIFKEKVKASFQVVRTQVSRMNAFLQERITGMRIVQIFNAEEQEMKKFKTINREYTQANLDSIFYYAIFFPVVEIISAASLGLMVWWGARGVIGETVSLGALIAFPIYLSMLFRPIRMLADKFNTLQMGLVAADRVFKLLDRSDKINDEGSLAPEKIEGSVKFKDVSFAYNERDYVLNDINFEILPGETLAIVGSTGSGKSTIINLISRFYEIQKGEILVDNENIRNYTLGNLREHIGLVLQDVYLFSGTILENITLRNPNISREDAIAAAKMIGADEFIQKLPGGYDYELMERGITMSMGQRQLVSFVRALVFNPNILILDEATSSIDPETEGIIQYAIEKLIAQRTSIIVAHRLSTIRHANKILVLDQGKMIEYGTHDELMQIEEGHYRELFEMQFFANAS